MNTGIAHGLVVTLTVLGAEVGAAQESARGAAPRSLPASTLCEDGDGQVYSQGAVAEIDGEVKRCIVGPHWVPFGSSSVKPTVPSNPQTTLSSPEAAVLAALRDRPVPTLDCDTILNTDKASGALTQAASGHRLIVNFWTPTCHPCKPVLTALAEFARTEPKDLSFLGVVQSGDPDLEPIGDWQLLRVKEMLKQYGVSFPTCVHASDDVTRRWQAQGVPLTLIIEDGRISRVALGADHGLRLIDEVR